MEKLNFDTIKHYQSFATVEEMDQVVRGFLYKYKSSLSDGAVKVLHFLWTYSVKVVGVSFAKYDTMAAAVQLSRRTVIRAVKTLEDLTFIRKIPTSRMNGKQGVNLFVIQPFAKIDSLLDPVSPQDVTRPVTPNKAVNKQSSLCENKKQNRIIVKETAVMESVDQLASFKGQGKEQGIRAEFEQTFELLQGEEQQPCAESKLGGESKQRAESKHRGEQLAAAKSSVGGQATVQVKAIEWHQFDPSFLPEYVNKEFIKAAQPFFHAGDIHQLWTKIHMAYKKVKLEADLDDVIETVIADFKQTIFLYKTGKIHTTFEGYLYSVVYRSLWYLKVKEYHQQWLEKVMGY